MTLRLRRFAITCCFTMGCLAPGIAAAIDSTVWTVHERTDGSARFSSPTTYVIAARHAFDGQTIRAFDATIFAEGWSIRAGELTIDPTVDAVKFTVLRTSATSPRVGIQE